MQLDELPGYVDRVPIYREFNERYFRLPPAMLAQRLIAELEHTGAVRCRDGMLMPA
jgi:hypothetical protein